MELILLGSIEGKKKWYNHSVLTSHKWLEWLPSIQAFLLLSGLTKKPKVEAKEIFNEGV